MSDEKPGPMTARTLGILGVRLIGLMAIVQALQTAPTLFGFLLLAAQAGELSGPAPALAYLPGLLWLLVLLAIGVSLIAYARPLGRRLFPEEEPVAWSVDARQLRTVLFAAVGALVLVEALPQVLRDVVTLVLAARQEVEMAGGGLWGEGGLALAEATLRAALGLVLLVGGRQLATLLGRLRRAGTVKGEPGRD